MPNQDETNLSALFDRSGNLVWLVDADYRLIAFNRDLEEYCKISFDLQIAAGMSPCDVLPPERLALWPALYARALAEGPFQIEYSLADGRTFEMTFTPISLGGGRTGVSVVGRDILECKRALQALAESEARFRRLFEENGSVMVLVEPASGKIVAANQAASRFFGYAREELMGMTVGQINALPPEEVALERQRALREERGFFNYRHRLASGEVREVEVYSSPIHIDGRTLLFSIVHDVTERRRAEEALRESGDFLKEAQRIGAFGCYVLDIRSGVWTSSSLLDELFGIDPEYERTVEGWEALIHPGDRAGMAAYFADEVVGEGKTFDREYRIVRQADGAERWVYGMGKIELDAQGQPLKMWGIIKDISERKRAEIELRASEERYRATFEQAAIGIAHTSLDGRILRCNPFFAEFLGYTVEELTGLTIQQITAPEDRSQSIEAIERIRSGATTRETLEKRYLRHDGARTWAKLTSAIQRDAEGRALHLVTVAEDINARKEAEKLLTAATEALRVSEQRYRTAFQTSFDTMGISRAEDGLYIDVNDAFLRTFGYEREEVIGHSSLELGIWADPEDRRRWIDAMQKDSACLNLEARLRRKGGEIIWGRISASIVELDDEAYVLTVSRNTTDEKAAQERLAAATEALRVSELRYRTAFQTSLDAININRLSDGTYIDCNQAFLDIVGYERGEVIGRTSLELEIWADSRDRQTMVNMVLQNSSCRGLEAQFRKKNGTVFWGQMSASLMEIDGVPCILSMTRDISEAKLAETTIRNLAFYDPLTGLANRRLLFERLRQAISAPPRRGHWQALLLVDLDQFRVLNETFSYQAGGLLLQQVAGRIVTCAQETDTVARTGGNEFGVILEELSGVAGQAAAKAKAVGEKILAEARRPYLLGDRECQMSASIGISVFGDRRSSADEILRQAVIAVHQAKAAGGNTLSFFSPALQAAVNARAALDEDLRQAIKKQQFLLYYQPQVEWGRLTGAEALIRWRHPRRGIVLPEEFIPTAEESSLILPLGDWALEAACAQIAAWAGRRETAHLEVAANISARQFCHPDFVTQVQAALERTGANPKKLKLELTESMLVDNIEEVIAKMIKLKACGLSFSLDDFGTGYSSLAYLKRLPLDQLKIDRVFVRDMMVDATSGAIAQTILSLGRAMGLSVIAEGVETDEQRGFLAALGCQSFQGYLFSPPLPVEDFQAFAAGFAENAVSLRK